MATYFNVEKKEFCEALEAFLKDWFKEDYTGKCAGGTFVGKVGVNKRTHIPAYFAIQVVEKSSEYRDRNYNLYTAEEYNTLSQKFKITYMPFDGESEVARYKERQEAVQKEKKGRVQKLLSVFTAEEKKELLKAFLDDIQNETEED